MVVLAADVPWEHAAAVVSGLLAAVVVLWRELKYQQNGRAADAKASAAELLSVHRTNIAAQNEATNAILDLVRRLEDERLGGAVHETSRNGNARSRE
jgi:hypothetical protein